VKRPRWLVAVAAAGFVLWLACSLSFTLFWFSKGPGQTAKTPDHAPSGPAVALPREITNSLGMKLVLIPKGTFQMGSPRDEENRSDDEDQHEVTITQPFYLGMHEVTQHEYEAVTGTNPSWFSAEGGGKEKVQNLDTSRFPVETVYWEDAVTFCRKLSERPEEKRSGRVYRLPTEAEWEYACRGGAREATPFHFGKTLSSLQANFNGNRPYGSADKGPYLQRTTKVGSYEANAFGLYDMHGNAREWCADRYGPYPKDKQTDPQGPEKGGRRVLRGGSWLSNGHICRVAHRSTSVPGNHSSVIGFRVVVPVALTAP
jgi:formylglycine-generating enzyme required for sulfatase activity